MSAEIVCSAPGKVLVSGGYLILDRPKTGAVLALSARFYSSVRLIACRAAQIEIDVFSPQFSDHRRYRFDASGPVPRLEALPPTAGASLPKPNPYVEIPLLYVLALALEANGADFAAAAAARLGLRGGAGVRLEVILAADNSFYSQVGELSARGLPLSAEAAAKLPAFLPPRRDEDGEIPKTGLGSSATLVTSLVSALLHTFGLVRLAGAPAAPAAAPGGAGSDADGGLEVLHALAQLCHCAAQGKVGSGFDVSAAVYGSHRYCRFSPALLQVALGAPAGVPPPMDVLLATTRLHGGGEAWDHEVVPLALPNGIELMMGDVCCGAHTPSMVKKVSAWRKEAAGATALWAEYAAASAALQAALQSLCALHADIVARGGLEAEAKEWHAPLQQCGALDAVEWEAAGGAVGGALAAVRAACLRVRELLRVVGRGAGVGIEPEAQTALLDATMEQRGVLLAVVPGAGGADAVVALLIPAGPVHGLLATRQRVSALWQCWAGGGGAADGPPRSKVCELPIAEASCDQSGGRNGVAVEGEAAARKLRAARQAMAASKADGPSGWWIAAAVALTAAAVAALLVTARPRRV